MARLLNEAGYRTRRGSKFSGTTVGRLLRDPIAKGLRRSNYSRNIDGGRKWELKPEEEWIYTKVEPVVSGELWERCNQILDEQRAKYRRPARRAVHLFAGIVCCHCGDKMYVPSNSPKYTCRKCRNKIPTGDLEAIFHEQLKSFLFSPADVREYLERADQALGDKRKLLEALIEEERGLRKEMDKTYSLYIDDKISGQGFAERYGPLEERVGQIGDEITALQSDIDFLRIRYLSSDELLTDAQGLSDKWPEMSASEKRKIVETIVDTIIIGDDDVTIDLLQLPSSSDIDPPDHTDPTDSSDQTNQPAAPSSLESVATWQRTPQCTSPFAMSRIGATC